MVSGTRGPNESYYRNLASDGTTLYWLLDDDQVFSLPVAGGTRSTLANTPDPWELTADANNAYWIDFDGAAYQLPKNGSGLITLYNAPSTSGHSIAVDSTTVYLGENYGNEYGYIVAVPIGGGAATTLMTTSSGSQNAVAIAVDSTSLYWAQGNGYATGSIMKLTPK